jgi:hypothetical protein
MVESIRARSLTSIQLKMLDAGAPVIIPCRTPAGEIVHVRLQTKNLAPLEREVVEGAQVGQAGPDEGAPGSWELHGAYVAIMPNGVDYGCEDASN